jgi:arylsulfatase A-like enzyme
MRMIRRGPWKACFAYGFPPTLYDLENDPHEWNDLGQDQAHSDLIHELSREAKADELVRLREEIVIHKRRLKNIAAAVS